MFSRANFSLGVHPKNAKHVYLVAHRRRHFWLFCCYAFQCQTVVFLIEYIRKTESDMYSTGKKSFYLLLNHLSKYSLDQGYRYFNAYRWGSRRQLERFSESVRVLLKMNPLGTNNAFHHNIKVYVGCLVFSRHRAGPFFQSPWRSRYYHYSLTTPPSLVLFKFFHWRWCSDFMSL